MTEHTIEATIDRAEAGLTILRDQANQIIAECSHATDESSSAALMSRAREVLLRCDLVHAVLTRAVSGKASHTSLQARADAGFQQLGGIRERIGTEIAIIRLGERNEYAQRMAA